MATVTKPIILDETGESIAAGIDRQNTLIGALVKSKIDESTLSWGAVRRIVQDRLAPVFFDIGDILWGKWTKGSTEYSVPWVVTHFEDVELQDGEVVPAMFLQSKYCFPDTIQFDATEALYKAVDGLAAGTYHFSLLANYDPSYGGGKTYQFTLAQPVPAGGVLMFPWGYNVQASTIKVSSYASNESTTAIEQVSVTEGTGGTNLGTADGNTAHMNHTHKIRYGSNRYMHSAVRQWINSEAAAGAWWTAQNEFDRPPTQLTSLAGLASGLEADFKAILQPIKVQVATNTVTDGGTTDIMYDKFFLPSLQQMYVNPQLAGVEGVYWEYWKRAMGRTTPIGTGSSNKNDALIHHILNADGTPGSAARGWWRSASRGDANLAWLADSAGYAGNGGAYYAYRAAPACAIC